MSVYHTHYTLHRRSLTLRHCAGQPNIPHSKLQSGGYCVSLVDRRPGPSCAAILFLSIPLFSRLLLTRNKPGCTGPTSQRSGLAVLIVPFYPSLHMKLIYTLFFFQHCLFLLLCAVQKRDSKELCKRDFMYVSGYEVVW